MIRRDEVVEEVAPEAWAPGDSLRHEWFKAQRLDPKFIVWIEKSGKDMPAGHRLASDGIIERCVAVAGGPTWVPYIPSGEGAVNISWRKWCFLMRHVGLLGGHRLTGQTLELLKRSVYWDKKCRRMLRIGQNVALRASGSERSLAKMIRSLRIRQMRNVGRKLWWTWKVPITPQIWMGTPM